MHICTPFSYNLYFLLFAIRRVFIYIYDGMEQSMYTEGGGSKEMKVAFYFNRPIFYKCTSYGSLQIHILYMDIKMYAGSHGF